MVHRMMTVRQIKAARALLGWRQVDLAAMSGVAEISVKNLEREYTDPRTSTMAKIEAALEKAGVEFMPGGVRLKG
jgi:predicted transcriptional regulator